MFFWNRFPVLETSESDWVNNKKNTVLKLTLKKQALT